MCGGGWGAETHPFEQAWGTKMETSDEVPEQLKQAARCPTLDGGGALGRSPSQVQRAFPFVARAVIWGETGATYVRTTRQDG